MLLHTSAFLVNLHHLSAQSSMAKPSGHLGHGYHQLILQDAAAGKAAFQGRRIAKAAYE